jgi:hypothetical protein
LSYLGRNRTAMITNLVEPVGRLDPDPQKLKKFHVLNCWVFFSEG